MSLGNTGKIEVYTEIDFNSAHVGEHAIDRAFERFNLKDRSRQQVADWIRNKLKHSKFKSIIRSEQYGIARLYVNDDLGIVLDIHKDIVCTIYQIEVRKNIKERMKQFLESECHRVNKKYKSKERSYKYKIADLNVEKALLERKLLRLKAQKSINQTMIQINEIDMKIATMTQELCNLQEEMSELEISLAAM